MKIIKAKREVRLSKPIRFCKNLNHQPFKKYAYFKTIQYYNLLIFHKNKKIKKYFLSLFDFLVVAIFYKQLFINFYDYPHLIQQLNF